MFWDYVAVDQEVAPLVEPESIAAILGVIQFLLSVVVLRPVSQWPLVQMPCMMLLNIQIVAGPDFTLFGYDQVKTMLCFLHRTLKF